MKAIMVMVILVMMLMSVKPARLVMSMLIVPTHLEATLASAILVGLVMESRLRSVYLETTALLFSPNMVLVIRMLIANPHSLV